MNYAGWGRDERVMGMWRDDGRVGGMGLLHGDVTKAVIEAFYGVYNALGFGFLERPYVNAMVRELGAHGHEVAREKTFELRYRDTIVGRYKADLIIDNVVLVEVKSTIALSDADRRQLRNYLRCSSVEVGLLLHFGPKPRFERMLCSRHSAAQPAQPV